MGDKWDFGIPDERRVSKGRRRELAIDETKWDLGKFLQRSQPNPSQQSEEKARDKKTEQTSAAIVPAEKPAPANQDETQTQLAVLPEKTLAIRREEIEAQQNALNGKIIHGLLMNIAGIVGGGVAAIFCPVLLFGLLPVVFYTTYHFNKNCDRRDSLQKELRELNAIPVRAAEQTQTQAIRDAAQQVFDKLTKNPNLVEGEITYFPNPADPQTKLLLKITEISLCRNDAEAEPVQRIFARIYEPAKDSEMAKSREIPGVDGLICERPAPSPLDRLLGDAAQAQNRTTPHP